MILAQSRLTSQGQISVPAEVRRKLGIGPTDLLEWDEKGDDVVVRRAGRFSFEDIHRALFGKKSPKPHTLDEMKQGIRRHIQSKHARR